MKKFDRYNPKNKLHAYTFLLEDELKLLKLVAMQTDDQKTLKNAMDNLLVKLKMFYKMPIKLTAKEKKHNATMNKFCKDNGIEVRWRLN